MSAPIQTVAAYRRLEELERELKRIAVEFQSVANLCAAERMARARTVKDDKFARDAKRDTPRSAFFEDMAGIAARQLERVHHGLRLRRAVAIERLQAHERRGPYANDHRILTKRLAAIRGTQDPTNGSTDAS